MENRNLLVIIFRYQLSNENKDKKDGKIPEYPLILTKKDILVLEMVSHNGQLKLLANLPLNIWNYY